MSVPAQIAAAAINKTLRCAVEVEAGVLWPVIGGQSLSETPGSANIETTQFFLSKIDFPGEEQPGQFQFNWGIIPDSPIDQLLIDAGRNKTTVSLDFRAPGGGARTWESAFILQIGVKETAGDAKGMSEIVAGGGSPSSTNTPWAVGELGDNGLVKMGQVIQATTKPSSADDDLFVVEAIKYSSAQKDEFEADANKSAAAATRKAFTRGVDTAVSISGFTLSDPNVRYRVSGTGVSFANDSSGAVPIGQLTMTVDAEPVYELIRSEEVDLAYQY